MPWRVTHVNSAASEVASRCLSELSLRSMSTANSFKLDNLENSCSTPALMGRGYTIFLMANVSLVSLVISATTGERSLLSRIKSLPHKCCPSFHDSSIVLTLSSSQLEVCQDKKAGQPYNHCLVGGQISLLHLLKSRPSARRQSIDSSTILCKHLSEKIDGGEIGGPSGYQAHSSDTGAYDAI